MLQNRARRFSRKLKIYFHLKLDKANEACARFIQTVFGIVINYYHCLVCLRRHRRLVIAEQNKTETFTCLVVYVIRFTNLCLCNASISTYNVFPL